MVVTAECINICLHLSFSSLSVVSCGMPMAPVNGSVVGQDFTLGLRVTFKCNPGFRLANTLAVSTVCQESGRWSPMETPPRCIRKPKIDR